MHIYTMKSSLREWVHMGIKENYKERERERESFKGLEFRSTSMYIFVEACIYFLRQIFSGITLEGR